MKLGINYLLVCTALAISPAKSFGAESFPTRPIRIIVNSAPGALLDVTTRSVAQEMSKNLRQPVIVENNAGASGLVGIRQVKNALPDGYTLLASANTIAQLPAFKMDPGYDLAKDFVGVGMMNRAPLLLVGASSQSEKTLSELITRAKSNPNVLSYASAGIGTSTHMAAALFMQQSGIKLLHVPYKGNAGAAADVLGGRVSMIFDGANSAGQHVQDGKLRAFGVTSPTRMAAFPDIPTLTEQGLPNYSFYVYMGLIAPAGTPKEIVQRLSQSLSAALSSESVRDRFRRDGAEAGNTTSDEFTEFLKKDMQRTIKVASDLGLPKE